MDHDAGALMEQQVEYDLGGSVGGNDVIMDIQSDGEVDYPEN